jgi:succinate dehydrogenase / fumarate reductase, iron-sulfur subunit
MQICFQIQRQSSEGVPQFERFFLDVSPRITILDCLNQIKWEQDGSLAFRKNCRNTICGSCAVRINGRADLACKQTLQDELERIDNVRKSSELLPLDQCPTIEISPMQNFPVIKDLVVDMEQFWQNLEQVDPYVSTASRAVPEREFLQSPSERAALNQVGNCILCGACYSECNAKTVIPEFVGPHALAKAYRIIADNRSADGAERLQKSAQDLSGVWGCTRCFNCNSSCPMDVAPLDQITRIKAMALVQPSQPESRIVRHREAMIDLVAENGWIDERRFGLRVLGNRFRDFKGLMSLIPLGFRMLLHRKFPIAFRASEGTQTIRAIIDALRMRK